MQFGRTYEEFEVGAVYKHWPGKTVTEYDDHLFCLLTMNHHPLHLDAHYAEEATDFGRNVVVGNYIYSLLLGMSVPTSPGRPSPTWRWSRSSTWRRPSTATRSTARPPCWASGSTSRGDRGVVEVETRGYNQDGTLVCVFRRKVMVPTETYVKERGGSSPAAPARSKFQRSQRSPPWHASPRPTV